MRFWPLNNVRLQLEKKKRVTNVALGSGDGLDES